MARTPARKSLPADAMVFRLKADLLKALAHPVRLAVLERLKDGEAPVGSMVRELGVEQSSLSRHLALLRQAGLLDSRQERLQVFYRVKDREIYRLLGPVADMLRRR